MEFSFQEDSHQANEVFFLRATLTEPVVLDGRLDRFREEIKRELSSTRPLSARNWSVQLETPARCVIRTSLSAPSEHEAAEQVLRAIKVACGVLEIQQLHVAVKAPGFRVEVGYPQDSAPELGVASAPASRSSAGPTAHPRRRS